MNRPTIAGIALLIVLGVLVNASLFTVHQTQRVLIAQFGEVKAAIDTPGLHAKLPFVQDVISFDRRLLNVELPGEEVILGDRLRLIVDTFTIFRISDPLKFYQAVGPLPEAIRGKNSLHDVLSADREKIMSAIRDQVNADMANFGVSIEDVRIRRADLPPENTQAILSRMQSERQRDAAQYRAEGAEASARIRAKAERERTVLLADGRATADKLRGEGEAEATKVYAAAFNKDPQFFGIWRTLQAYRDVFDSGGGRLVLTPDNEFLRYLQAAPVPTGP